jgi:hypothetical protein
MMDLLGAPLLFYQEVVLGASLLLFHLSQLNTQQVCVRCCPYLGVGGCETHVFRFRAAGQIDYWTEANSNRSRFSAGSTL